MSSKDPTEVLNKLMDGLAEVSGLLAMTVGYRAKALAEGFSDEAAEELAVQMHGLICRAVNKSKEKE